MVRKVHGTNGTKSPQMVRKVHGTKRPWYEKSINGTKRLWDEKSMVRKVWQPLSSVHLCKSKFHTYIESANLVNLHLT